MLIETYTTRVTSNFVFCHPVYGRY